MTPCPRCAQPLHWVAQYQQWYCATCQTYVPPAAPPVAAGPPPIAPTPPPGPSPAATAAAPGAPARSKTGWIVGGVIAVVAVGGIVTAVALSGGGDRDTEGDAAASTGSGADRAEVAGGSAEPPAPPDAPVATGATPESLVRALFDAYAAGNGTAAVGLLPPLDDYFAALDCPDEPRAKIAWADGHNRAEIATMAGGWGNLAPRLRKVTPGELFEVAAGEEYSECRARTPFALQTIHVEVEYTHEGAPATHTSSLYVSRIGDRWFLASGGEPAAPLREAVQLVMQKHREDHPPPGGSGLGDVADGGRAALAELKKLTEFACDCKSAGCADTMESALERYFERHEHTQAHADVAAEAEQVAVQLGECLARARGEELPAPAPAPSGGSTGIPACDEYLAIMEAWVSCDALDPEIQKLNRSRLPKIRREIVDAPADLRDTTADSCEAAAAGLRAGLAKMGCKAP